MRQYRDRLQLRTRREPPVPPIEKFNSGESLWDRLILGASILALALILILASIEGWLARAA